MFSFIRAGRSGGGVLMPRSSVLLLVGIGLLVLGGCGGPAAEQGDDGLQSATTGAEPDGGVDTGAGDGSNTRSAPDDATAGSDGSVESSGGGGTDRPSSIVPTAEFQRLPADQFGNASTEIALADAAATGDRSWLVVGSLEDGRRRTVRATVAAVFTAEPARNRRIELPTGGADRSAAGGVAISGESVVVVGLVGSGDRTTPVLWTGDSGLDDWELVELPPHSSALETTADRVVQSDGLRYVIGRALVDGFDQPVAWRENDRGWQAMPVESEPDRNVSALAAAIVSNRLVAVGRSAAATGDPSAMVWIERNGVLARSDERGLPANGSLHDIATRIDGSLVAVGSSTIDGISTPMVATAQQPGDRWTATTTEVDLAGWVSFDGVEFGRLIIDGDDLYTSLTNPVVQQVSRSSDGGRAWQRVGNLSAAGTNFVPADAMVLGPDGSILVAGADVAMEWSGAQWSAVADPDAVPSQRGAVQAVDVVAGDRGFVIGGGRTARTDTGLRFEAVLWQSPDGTRWGRPPIDEPTGYMINRLDSTDAGPLGIKGGGSYFTPVHVVRPDTTGRWRSTILPVGAAFLDRSIGGPGDTIVAAGSRPRADLSQTDPLFVIVEPDDRVREIPLTDSPVPADANASVQCLAGRVGRLIAVLEWGDGEIGIATGSNGERWRGLDIGGSLDGLAISDCHGDENGFLLGGRDALGRAVVARSDDGSAWGLEIVSDRAAVLGIDRVDGQLLLSGWITGRGGLGRDGAIWRVTPAGWERLSTPGLDGDAFARFIEVSGLAARDGVVVAVGSDRGRAGAWVATIEALSN